MCVKPSQGLSTALTAGANSTDRAGGTEGGLDGRPPIQVKYRDSF